MKKPVTGSNNLPEGVRTRLEYVAAATGEIDAADIAAFAAVWPSLAPDKVSAVVSLLDRIDGLCSGSMLDPDETLLTDESAMNAVRALAEIVKQSGKT